MSSFIVSVSEKDSNAIVITADVATLSDLALVLARDIKYRGPKGMTPERVRGTPRVVELLEAILRLQEDGKMSIMSQTDEQVIRDHVFIFHDQEALYRVNIPG